MVPIMMLKIFMVSIIEPLSYDHMNQNTRQRSSTDASSDNKLQRLQSRPRPTPKKAQSSSGQIETGIRPPAQSSEYQFY